MAPRKKTPTMKWVVKSQQPAKMAESAATEKKTSSEKLGCSLLTDSVSKLQLSSSSSAKMVQPATKEQDGWSYLPEELLHIISEKLEDCFDAIHARSVCRPWRSIFPFPSWILRTRYSLPAFEKYPSNSKSRSRSKTKSKNKEVCTLEKFPMFLFRVRAPGLPCDYFVGGLDQEDDMELLPSPLQCSVKVKIPKSDMTLFNILDCQNLLLGYQYGMKGYDPNSLATRYRGVAFLPLNMEGGEGGAFVVLMSYSHDLWVLTSAEMRWMRLEKVSRATSGDIVTFRGKFYVEFMNGDIFVIDPYSLEATPLMPLPMPLENMGSQNYLVPCGNDELFLVESLIKRNDGVIYFNKLVCRVSRLDEEAGEWVVVTDLGDRVLLIGQPGNTFCSGKGLPDGCGVTGNSLLFTSDLFSVICSYQYGVDIGNPEDNFGIWRFSEDTRVTILSRSPMTAHLRVDRRNP